MASFFEDQVLDELCDPDPDRLDGYFDEWGSFVDVQATICPNEFRDPPEISCPPSRNQKDWWLNAIACQGEFSPHTTRSGKWLLFVEEKFIDDAWEQIYNATISGELTEFAKCSTKKSKTGPKYVICVYTPDWKDFDDVMRVRDKLRDLGFESPAPYKTDEDTRARKYAKTHKGIAKFFE